MLGGKLVLHFLVGNDRALFHVDQQHLAGLQTPLLDDALFRHWQRAGLGSHDDAVVISDEVTGRAQAVAVERRANLLAVGEGNGGGTVPRLHQGCVIFVECLAFGRHGLVTGPGFRDQHHHRVGHGIATADEELERVVETGRVRLAFIGNRPELGDVVTEQRGRNRCLTRRHPVDITAQRVDFAVMGDHAIGVRQLPRREGVGGETLMHERDSRFETRVRKVLVICAHLIGEEHPLIDDGRGRKGNGIEILRFLAAAFVIDAVGENLADEEQLALEIGIARGIAAGADEDLHMVRLGRCDIRRLGKRGIVDRDITEAKELLALFAGDVDDDLLVVLDAGGIARHEDMTDGVFASLRQCHALRGHFLAEEAVGNLHENARTIAHQRICADGAAMGQVFKDEQAVLDDLVRLDAFHMGDKANAAGIMFIGGIVKTLPFRQAARETRFRRNGCSRSRGGTVSGQGCGGDVRLRLVRHFCPSCKLLARFHAKVRRDANFALWQNPHSRRLDQI